MPTVTANTAKVPSGMDPTKNPWSEQDRLRFGKWLAAKLEEWQRHDAFNFHLTNVAVSYAHMHGLDVEGVGANATVVTRSGEQGTIAELRIPKAASLIEKQWNIVVGPEFTWTTVATNTDFANEAKAVTARNALDYYWLDKGVSALAKASCKEGLRYAEAAMHMPWNADAGEVVGVDEMGVEVHEGDIDYRPTSTWNIIRDPTAKSYSELDFIFVREFHNKWDLAAKVTPQPPPPDAPPDYAEAEAARVESVKSACLNSNGSYQYWAPFLTTTEDDTRTMVYFGYHKRTPSVPEGRQVVMLPSGDIISDEPLDEAFWEEKGGLPVHRYATGSYEGTPFPYCKAFSILGAGQARDALHRDLLTNATSVASNIISVVENSDFPVSQLGGGVKVIERGKDDPPPEALDLHSSNPEHFKLSGYLDNEMTQIIGLDALTAGNEIGASLSGAAMTMMTSTSVQNNSQDQAAWADYATRLGRATLAHIDVHMSEPRKVMMAGKTRASLVQAIELSSEAIKGVKLVQVTLGSAMQQTQAGKQTIMEMAFDKGWLQTPQQVQTVLDTGRLDAATEDLSNELLLVKQENEALGEGETVPVMLDDNHALHLKLHRAVSSSLTARRNPQVVEALQAHQNEHLRVLMQTDPSILQLFGQPSIAAPPAPGGPPSGTQPPQSGQESASGGEEAKPSGGPPKAVQKEAQPPSLPRNPATGERAGPAGGTIPPALAVRQ